MNLSSNNKNLFFNPHKYLLSLLLFLLPVLYCEAANPSRRVEGKILNVKKVSFKNTNKDNIVILIKTKIGHEELVVDLGDADRLNRIVDSGSNVIVEGIMVKIDSKVFLLAQKVILKNQLLKVNRTKYFPKAE
ncbi:MAG: hypothetical protein KC478_13975 [Bacteriovoracaceae bacterium]|nr:hypothetical protein [Bacteriovoracaceae bacterium]